jgi:MFS family permease
VSPPGRRRPLVALLASFGISSIGSAMTLIAIPWFVLEVTGSGTQTGLVAAAETIGMVLSVALAGPLMDRFGARRTSVVADLLTALVILAVPVAHATTGISLFALLAIAFAIGAGRSPARSAKQVMLPHVIARSGTSVERGTSAAEGAQQSGDLFGAPIGGVLIALLGPANVLLVDAGALLTVAVLVWTVDRQPAAAASADALTSGVRGYFRDLRDAVSRLRADNLLLVICCAAAASNALTAGLLSVLVPAYGLQVWHDSPLVGAIVAAAGAGSLVGTILYGWLGHRLNRWATYAGSFVLCGAPVYLVVLLDLPPVALVALVGLCYVGFGPINPVVAAVKYERIPPEVRGRVFSAFTAATGAATPLGLVLAGTLLDVVGLVGTVAFMGSLSLLVTLCPVVFPVWRQMQAPVALAAGKR